MNDTTLKPSGVTSFQSDNLQRFIFDNAPVRGEWVHMQDSWQQVLTRREYPPAIQHLLGQMMAAAALLAATVKIKGRLVLQIKSAGPVDLMMVECTSDNTLRAFAQWDGHVADDATMVEVTGEGTLAITIEVEGAKQPYQGVVSLQGDSIAAVLETYFTQSEQLDTKIWLAADENAVAGLFLQQMPSEQHTKDEDEENWSRLSQLAATVTTSELLELGVGTLLHRLFHEEECRLLQATELTFACNCSRERVADTISLLGEKDAHDLLEEKGIIEAACEFCNEHYRFDKVDVAQIFSDVAPSSSDSSTLH
ncbi:MAG: Hsp33 family molecular chaperone HslO [Gammaproteobacteria bacterium]|nr:Hsp33 family molecular chaperone HslO [Gammaproteobacteria bacterium]